MYMLTRYRLLAGTKGIKVLISSLFRQKACKVSKEDDVMSIITIADIQVDAPVEVVSIVITEDDE